MQCFHKGSISLPGPYVEVVTFRPQHLHTHLGFKVLPSLEILLEISCEKSGSIPSLSLYFFLAAACEILVPLPVIEPRPSAVKTWSPRKVKGKVSVRLFETPWTVACQVPLSMGFSRQGYWSGLPFPSQGDPGIKPGSPVLQAGSLPSEPPRNP